MELPRRKPNRLKDYDYSQNGAYFITICVKDKQELLGEIMGTPIVGGDVFISHIAPPVPCEWSAHIELSQHGMIVEKYISSVAGIDKYIIMPNHVHMIIFIQTETDERGAQSVSQLVKSFKTLVTKEIGFSLWQRSFHDRIIRNEYEYQQIWTYIDDNPANWAQDCFYPK